MTYNEFVLKWSEASSDSKRINSSHPLDFYLSKDENYYYKLLFIGGKKRIDIKDSDVIKVNEGKRNDGKIAYSFILINKSYTNQFFRLCYDLVDSSKRCANNESNCNFVISLFVKWQKMMKNSSKSLLSMEEIKGLIGELIVLDNLLEEHNCEDIINSWSGPDGYYQDFTLEDTWIEVKAISKSGEKITISSIEQLDVPNDGKLLTIMLDKVDSKASNSINLNSIINKIELQIKHNIKLIDNFRDKLNMLGYIYSEEYDKLNFQVGNITEYLVDKDFPRLRRDDIRYEIGKVKYEIILATIKKWCIGDNVWNYGNLERIS